jgi:hypothetical protein
MPGWCPYCGKTIDELYANVLRRKGELWHRKCWKASCKEIADARRANEDRLDNIIGHPKREWSVKKPEPETWNEKISRRVVASCPRCGKVIPDLTDDIVIRGKKLYHRDCWKTEAKGKEIARRSIDDIISGRFEQRRWNLDKLARKSNREWTIKYGSRIIKRKGQKPKRTRPYIKEIHYHKPGQPDITLDVGYLRPWHNKDGDIKEHFVVNSVMFLPGGGEFPWHLRLVTTEHRLAKECREQVQRKNRFARILSKTFYGRKWYVVYENYHKGKITGMTSAPRSERSRTQEREIKEEIKRHNELALKRMRDNNPNPGTYKHLLETLPSSISGRKVMTSVVMVVATGRLMLSRRAVV